MTTEPAAATINPWHVAQRQFDLAADRLDLDPGLRRVLREPRRELTVHFPVKMDDGSVAGLHRLPRPAQPRPRPRQGRHPLPPGRDPGRGQGPRDVDDLEVRRRRHPVRWRQGRRRRRPQEALDAASSRRLTRRYATEIEVLIGPERDIPAPDVNTNAQMMAWIMDTYSMHEGYTVPGVVTGKPISLGGSEGRNEATARGCVYTSSRRRKHLGMDLRSARVAVQGFGNAGSIAAQLMPQEGATVVAVSDSAGGIHNMNGLDIDRVIAWKKEHGTVVGFPGSDEIRTPRSSRSSATSSSRRPSRTRSPVGMPAASGPRSSPRPRTGRPRPRPTRSSASTASS